MKRSTGILAFLTVAALVAAGCGGRDDSSSSATTAGSATTGASSATTAAAAPTTAGEPAQATDIGITATEIHIGVVADVDTPISPGLSQPLVAAVKAWGDQVNANGGLAGRKVVVTFYDSKLNPDEAVNAYTQACQNEFATVGSGAFVLLNPDPIQTCKDKAGNAIGLPDVAALTIAAGAATSKSSYGIIQAGQDFTAAQPTFTVTEYGWNYYFSKLGGSAASANQIGIDPGVPGIGPGILAAGQALTELGGKFAGKVVYPDAAPAVRGDADHPEDQQRRDQLGGKHVDRGRQAHGRSPCARPRHEQDRVVVHLAVPVAVVRQPERRGGRGPLHLPAPDAVRRDRRPGREAVPRGRHQRPGRLGER